MKIGIIKETKVPEDNRVALTPDEIVTLQQQFPACEIVVQRSDIRAYTDEEYACKGIKLVERVDDCDVLFGIKEADIESLIPDKHYFFFGHIAKKQPYNRSLIKKMMALGITFTDYEYLVDECNVRLCAFGWWAGVVGVYNTLRAYGIRYKQFELPEPDRKFTLDYMLKTVKGCKFSDLKIILTGNGKVSRGVQYFLDNVGAKRVDSQDFLVLDEVDSIVYTVLELPDLVNLKDQKGEFDRNLFHAQPDAYESNFLTYAKAGNVFISSHFWGECDPVYLSQADLKNPNVKIKIIGDITCDIQGSIHSTVRATTHANPFYDYNPETGLEETAFSSDDNITVMAVDTLPNALALDTSAFFGEALMKHVFGDILQGNIEGSKVIERATILKEGHLTERFSYLEDYALN